jgi:hypothetical protein
MRAVSKVKNRADFKCCGVFLRMEGFGILNLLFKSARFNISNLTNCLVDLSKVFYKKIGIWNILMILRTKPMEVSSTKDEKPVCFC